MLTLLLVAMAAPGVADSAAPGRCAARVAIELQVTDVAKQPIGGAEVWYIDTLGNTVAPSQASLIGTSDAAGRLAADICYVTELFFCAGAPKGRASLRFMVVKDGFGVLRLEHTAQADAIVKDGWALDGVPCEWEKPLRKRRMPTRGYPVTLTGTLRPIQ